MKERDRNFEPGMHRLATYLVVLQQQIAQALD